MNAEAGPALQLAGVPRLHVAGAVHALPWRDAALLAWLAVEGPTPRARLAALLWPGAGVEAARNSLRQRLFKLRRLAGTELVAGHEMLALAPGLAHDLAAAPSLLGELPCEVEGEFAQWLQAQRRQRRESERDTLAARCEAAAAGQDWPAALALAQLLLAQDPLAEAAHRRVMRLHQQAGDRAAALLAFDRCERLLKQELGVPPSAETLALLAELSPPAAAAGANSARSVAAATARPPRLVGREAEWQALAQAWGDGDSVFVTGEAGLGKSRLLGDFARSRPGTVVAGARPGDERVPWASAARLLRAWPAPALAEMPAAVQAELARLRPELGTAPPLRQAADRTRFFNAVAALFEAPGSGVRGVVFDDLQFADDASVELLQFLAAGTRCGWCFAARGAELSAAGRGLREALSAAGSPRPLRPLPLQPLSVAQVAELLDSLALEGLHGATHAPALWRHAGGNPLFLLETVKAWLAAAAEGAAPAGALPAVAHVGQLIQQRLARLSPAALQLARCAALAAPDFSAALATQVLQQRALQLADPWAELEAAQVLDAEGAFAHDLVLEATRAAVPPGVAAALRGQIARCLAAGGGVPARLAAHWSAAGCWREAAEAFEAAARQAAEGARAAERCALLADAAAHWQRAGDSVRRFEALLQRAQALVRHDTGDAARAALEEAEAAAPGEAAVLSVQAARLDWAVARFDVDEALRLAPPALAKAQALGDAELVRRLAIACSGALGDARRTAEGVRVLEPLVDTVQHRPDDEAKWEFHEAYALALDYDGQLRSAAAQWQACERLARVLQRPDLTWRSVSNGAATLGKLGRMAEAVQRSRQAFGLARTLGEAGRVRLLQMQLPHAGRLRDAGCYAEALPLLEACVEGLREEGSDSDAALAEQRLAVLVMQLGQPARAVSLLAPERPRAPAGVRSFRRVLQAELARLTGGEALAAVREALALVPRPDDIFHRMACLYATAIVPAEEADTMAQDLVAWATARDRQGLRLAAHARAALGALRLGEPERALPHVAAGRALVADFRPDSFYIGELWWHGARAFDALGRREEADAVAREGAAWVRALAREQVPPAFVDSFLHRNPVNRELLARAGAAG